MSSVQLSSVSKQFGDSEVITEASLDIQDGEFVVFVGPSGCGKSTLLRLIAGLEDVTSGAIAIAGRDVTDVAAVDRGIAMVFQSYALYPHMTVEQNMGFGLKMNGVDRQTVGQKVEAAAQTLQLKELLKRKPKQLSGGQRQRVAIGRAIVRNPGVFLFDEPLSNLDAELRVEMRLQIARLHKDLDATMIYVTHDQTEAMTMADRIVVLRAGQVEQIGTPLELYHRPANLFVAGFIGSPKMNFLPALVREPGDEVTTVELADGQQFRIPANSASANIGESVTLGVRPEDCAATGGEIGLNMQIDVAEHLGNSTFLYGHCSGTANFVVQRPGADATRAGEAVQLQIDPDRVYLFDSNGRALVANST